MMAFSSAYFGVLGNQLFALFFALIRETLPRCTSVLERELECSHQSLGFFVGLGGRRDADIQTTEGVDLVVFDFREDDLFFDADVVVTATVEGATIDTAEVTNAGSETVTKRSRNSNMVTPRGDHATDWHVFADLETSDSLTGHGDHGLWPAILVMSPTALSMTFLSDTAS